VVDLFKFSHGGNRNEQEGCVTILLDLKKEKKKKKKRAERVDKAY